MQPAAVGVPGGAVVRVLPPQVDSLSAMSVWKWNWEYCWPFEVGNSSRKLDGYMFGVRPVGHSFQYGVPSKSRSPFWKMSSWQPVIVSGCVDVPTPS